MGISVAPLTHVYPKKNDLLSLRELEMSSVANSEKARKIARGFIMYVMSPAESGNMTAAFAIGVDVVSPLSV